MTTLTVSGKVKDARTKKGLANFTVKAWDKELRQERLLGKAVTDRLGSYEIQYTRDLFQRPGKKSADLVVRAFHPATESLLAAESKMIYNAGPAEIVDLTVTVAYSEYERYLAAVKPVCGRVRPADLKAEDIQFIFAETKIPAQAVSQLSEAGRLAGQTGLPAEIFYGLLRKGLPAGLEDLLDQDLTRLRTALAAALQAKIIPSSLQEKLEEYLERLSGLKATLPAFRIKPAKKKLHSLFRLDLAESQAAAVVKKAEHAALVKDEILADMVKAKELKEAEAKAVGLTATLYTLLDEDLELVKTVKAAAIPSLTGNKVSHPADLARLDRAKWLELLEQAGSQPPSGMTREAYAALVSKKVEMLYPGRALLACMAFRTKTQVVQNLKKIKPLFAKNDKVFGPGRFELLDLSGLAPEVVTDMRAAYTALLRTANAYPGLGIREIFDDPQPAEGTKAKQVEERVALLEKLFAQNPDREFMRLDYSAESTDVRALNFTGINQTLKSPLLQTVKAWQRMYAVTQDSGHAKLLLALGYHSPLQIAKLPIGQFIAAAGLEASTGKAYHDNACAAAARSITGLGVIGHARGSLQGRHPFDNVDESVADYLKKIEGWETLFGSLDYCQCAHCRSILGPAAYFVDLMQFVEMQILSQFPESGGAALHPLHLRRRRPDLWDLPLTCENTNQLLPYLDIINEVLENDIALRLGYAANSLPAPGADRSALEDYVYAALLNSVKSLQQPFSLHLERLNLYLSHFDLTRGDLAKYLAVSADDLAAAALNLTRRGADAPSAHTLCEYELIVAPHTDLPDLRQWYGLLFTESGGRVTYRWNGEAADENNVQRLLKSMEVTRDELGALIATGFVRTGSATSSGPAEVVTIQSEKRVPDGPDASVQNDIERIHGLTRTALDRMHRFVRLWRKLPWSIMELDLALTHLSQANIVSGLQADTLPRLADILGVQKRFGLSLEQICALWSNIPRLAAGKLEPLFDQLFNLPDFVRLDGSLPKSGQRFLHPAFRAGIPPEADHTLHRLLAGLRVDDQVLYQLIVALQEPLGLHLERPSDTDKTFDLNEDNLALLYRHAQLAKRLGLTVAELFRLITLADQVSRGYIDDLHDLVSLLEFYDWWQGTDYTLDELNQIVRPAAADLAAADLAAAVPQKVFQSQALLFCDTVFAFLEGVTEEQSRAIVHAAANSGIFIPAAWNRCRVSASLAPDAVINLPDSITGTPDELAGFRAQVRARLATYQAPGAVFDDNVLVGISGLTEVQSRAIVAANPEAIQAVPLKNVFWLSAGFPETPLTIPAGIPVTDAKAKELLLTYHAVEVIPAVVAGELGLAGDKVKAIFDLAGIRLAGPEYTRALQEHDPDRALPALMQTLLPLLTWLKNPVLDAAAIDFLKQHPDLLGPLNTRSLTMRNVRKLVFFSKFLGRFDQPDPARLSYFELLLQYHPADRVFYTSAAERERVQAALARALAAETGLVVTAHAELTLPEEALEALEQLDAYLQLSQRLGVSGEVLKLSVSNEYKHLKQAANSILGAFRSKYENADTWKEKIAPFDNKIRSRKRDALADFLLHSVDPAVFSNRQDLYYYFLLDVELEGCARTSRIVAATAGLQLYVQRVLLHLEQDRAETLTVQMPEAAAQEWEWRKNYRVWEANRKVFLYPENYLEPDLRDNKTPLFKELEATLLQREINKDTVLEAYARYMRGFDETAHLKIAGTYHDKGEETDILHLFGVTAGQTPVYYYRWAENLYWAERAPETHGVVWHPWQKLDVQIPVGKVAPIVCQDRLHVFWLEIKTRPLNDIVNGSSEFSGYQHKVAVKFIKLQLDGNWTQPQTIALKDPELFPEDDGVITEWLQDGRFTIERDIKSGEYVFAVIPKYGREDDAHLDQVRQTAQTITVDDQEVVLSETTPYGAGSLEAFCQIVYDIFTFQPMDTYTLKGFQWEQLYPHRHINDYLILDGLLADFYFKMRRQVDFYKLAIGPILGGEGYGVGCFGQFPERRFLCAKEGVMYYGSAPYGHYLEPYVFATSVLEAERIGRFSDFRITPCLYQWRVAEFRGAPAELSCINGSLSDAIVDCDGDLIYFQDDPRGGANYLLKRLGTTLSGRVAAKLFSGGVEGLLDIEHQQSLQEGSLPLRLQPHDVAYDGSNAGCLDFSGPYGVYYEEIFFHVPFLIANHLSSQGKYALAQEWYHYIFDPAAPAAADSGPDSRPQDRMWRYLNFRNRGIESLRRQLADTQALEAYKKDPFNPHAIARQRLNAYQKNMVMKYIDNLLDWGDSLFAQDTMESINEATLLYILAADILGDPPAKLGPCGEDAPGPLAYKDIAPTLGQNSGMLIEMFHLVQEEKPEQKTAPKYQYTLNASMMHSAAKKAESHVAVRTLMNITSTAAAAAAGTATAKTTGAAAIAAAAETAAMTEYAVSDKTEMFLGMEWRSGSQQAENYKKFLSFLISWGNQISPVFCIPENREFKSYWDRVQDRLFKIRNCMNISGVRRELSLFAPEINPMLLVRARAAGLSLEDVLNSLSGNLPPYRFAFLIERAKAYAGLLQGFGNALQNALEKKDVETLNMMRSEQQLLILQQTRQMRQAEISAAAGALKAIQKRKDAAAFRKTYYQDLITAGLHPAEALQAEFMTIAGTLRLVALGCDITAAVLHLVPEVGAPTAMKYGGIALGNSATSFADFFRMGAQISDEVASLAGLAAGFERRKESWQNQADLADYELAELDEQIKVAEIRVDISNQAMAVHDKTQEQQEEVYAFYKDRFTNLGLYTWLSTTLLRLYKDSYNNAYAMAKLAEQAYRFERGNEAAEMIGRNHWEAGRAGLLAGERLLLDLQNLERRYLETNFRNLEIDQAFSLTQINPAALIQLKQTGTCSFGIPEVFFDLFYPGHYRRKIKAVRLSLPCITGPYTNVSASLRLTGSWLRNESDVQAPLLSVPLTRTVAIAASTAQNDSGVFELNFRDERYMPFEGAGAVSEWELSLPKNFRQFDYQTINDVILHISYTAEADSQLRSVVEAILDAQERSLHAFLTDAGDPARRLRRVFSLRQEFSFAFSALLHSRAGQPVTFELLDKHFPVFLKGHTLAVRSAALVLSVSGTPDIRGVELSFNDHAVRFSADPRFGALPAADLGGVLPDNPLGRYTLTIANAGPLAPEAPAPSDPSAVDAGKLNDVYLYLEYGLGT